METARKKIVDILLSHENELSDGYDNYQSNKEFDNYHIDVNERLLKIADEIISVINKE